MPALSSEHKVIGIIVCHTVIVYFPNDIKISESLSSQRGNRGLGKAKRPGNVPQLAPESADKEASSGLSTCPDKAAPHCTAVCQLSDGEGPQAHIT